MQTAQNHPLVVWTAHCFSFSRCFGLRQITTWKNRYNRERMQIRHRMNGSDVYILFWQIKYIIFEDESIAKLLTNVNRDSRIVKSHSIICLLVLLFVYTNSNGMMFCIWVQCKACSFTLLLRIERKHLFIYELFYFACLVFEASHLGLRDYKVRGNNSIENMIPLDYMPGQFVVIVLFVQLLLFLDIFRLPS